MSDKTQSAANCITYVREGRKSEFRVGTLSMRDKKEIKKTGDLWPRKSLRAYTVAFQRGKNQFEARKALKAFADFLTRTRPMRTEVLVCRYEGGELVVEARNWTDIKLESSPPTGLTSLAALKKEEACPFIATVIFGNARHWKDAVDDMGGAERELKDDGFLRGYIEVPWGLVEAIENHRDGIYAQLKKPSWMDDEDEDEDDYDDILDC